MTFLPIKQEWLDTLWSEIRAEEIKEQEQNDD